ncbi:hypothetical protein OH76DRAFT_1398817 [Lentinus brumalis]|uniref:F-box domain-containing protein n=1 Tax=Lentinus brumalis TaxID=2498619 RepID=A0A371DMF8_9APHY|nr:hypothetical protein OH76DRAFT_1398817 [Polyporus brumalis]
MSRFQTLKDRIKSFKKSTPKPCAVDHIPVELLESIFGLACTDGGSTGCSLSQVSKRFRAIARTSRFDCVALRSGCAPQIAKFTSCLVAERQRAGSAGSLVKVGCLFLTTARRTIRRNHPGAKEELGRYQQDVSDLIELVAPDVHTLLLLSSHLSWDDELRFPDIGLVSYPKLRELSLYGRGSKFAPMAFPSWQGLDSLPSTEDLAEYPELPKLTHLHLTSDPGYVRTRNPNMHRWAERAPGLTHLCLSNWKSYHLFIATAAADIIGLPDRTPLFERMEVFIVQGDTSLSSGALAKPSVVDGFSRTVEELRDMHRRSTRRWAQIPPFKQPLDWEEEYEQAATREWACWEAGHPGCWAVDESYFNHAASESTLGRR